MKGREYMANQQFSRIDTKKLMEFVAELNSNQLGLEKTSFYFSKVLSNYLLESENMKQKEAAQHLLSQNYWTRYRKIKTLNKPLKQKYNKPKVGDIWRTDFGNAYLPEIGYPHPAIILDIIDNLVLVSPITSVPNLFDNAYHPSKNPLPEKSEQKKYKLGYRLYENEFGIKKNSTVKLTETKCISPARLISRMSSMIDENDKSTEELLQKFNLENEKVNQLREIASAILFNAVTKKNNVKIKQLSSEIEKLKNELNEKNATIEELVQYKSLYEEE